MQKIYAKISEDYYTHAIENAVKKADDPEAKFFEHKKVLKWLESWGTGNELEPPK